MHPPWRPRAHPFGSVFCSRWGCRAAGQHMESAQRSAYDRVDARRFVPPGRADRGAPGGRLPGERGDVRRGRGDRRLEHVGRDGVSALDIDVDPRRRHDHGGRQLDGRFERAGRKLDRWTEVTVFFPRTSILPEELAVVVNDNDPLSVQVADDYVAARQIPPENVVHLGFATGGVLPPEDFDPIAQDLDAQLGPDIQAIALTFTNPHRVGCTSVTSAFAFGFDTMWCNTSGGACGETAPSAYYDSDRRRQGPAAPPVPASSAYFHRTPWRLKTSMRRTSSCASSSGTDSGGHDRSRAMPRCRHATRSTRSSRP